MIKIIFITLFLLIGTIGLNLFLIPQDTTIAFAQNKTKTVLALTKIHHVFVIVEENRDWSEIYKNTDAPYLNNSLLKKSAFAKDYHNTPKNLVALHPSEPNYILLEAGKDIFGDNVFTTNDNPSSTYSTNSTAHLTFLLEKNHFSWKSYQEDISGNTCPIVAEKNYVPKHNPFIYFQDVSGNPPSAKNTTCQKHIRPLTQLQKDLKNGTVANYTFITPNLQHDMHDGTVNQADNWLAAIVPQIEQSTVFKKDGVLFITWDEGSGNETENKAIGMIVDSPFGKKGYATNKTYSHASFVKTIQEIFHLSPLLGLAADPTTNDLSDLFQ